MKKTTKYATRRTTRLMSSARRKVLDGVKRDVESLKTTAGLHAWAGSNVSVIVHASCRLIFIALGAAAVAPAVHWLTIDANTPQGKLQLISRQSGIAQHGTYKVGELFYTHWAPLPTFAPDDVHGINFEYLQK